MNKIVNFSILGCGNIAALMAETVSKLHNVSLYAVSSRSLSKAKNFAETYGFFKWYGSYEAMVKDPNIDIVYIATPHSEHHLHSILCLNNHKNILCEKAFMLNYNQASEVILTAKRNNLFCAEAMWTRFQPLMKNIRECLDSIGEISAINANLGYNFRSIKRNWDLSLGGGVLLDLGVYPINFALMIIPEKIIEIKSICNKMNSEVDAYASILLRFESGKIANIHCSQISKTDSNGYIYGEKGYAIVKNINNPELIKVYNSNNELQKTIYAPKKITGYEYEVLASIKAIKDGHIECDEMPHSETLKIMKMLDTCRYEWGIKYSSE